MLDYIPVFGTSNWILEKRNVSGGIFNDSIDLENTYIKVDNNYIVKGYLTDNDRLIATNKGWGITG